MEVRFEWSEFFGGLFISLIKSLLKAAFFIILPGIAFIIFKRMGYGDNFFDLIHTAIDSVGKMADVFSSFFIPLILGWLVTMLDLASFSSQPVVPDQNYALNLLLTALVFGLIIKPLFLAMKWFCDKVDEEWIPAGNLFEKGFDVFFNWTYYILSMMSILCALSCWSSWLCEIMSSWHPAFSFFAMIVGAIVLLAAIAFLKGFFGGRGVAGALLSSLGDFFGGVLVEASTLIIVSVLNVLAYTNGDFSLISVQDGVFLIFWSVASIALIAYSFFRFGRKSQKGK